MGHSVCQSCHKGFACPEDLKQHNDASHRWKCPQCSERHSTKSALANHQRISSHCYCGDCNKSFSSLVAMKSHLQSSLHSTEFRCCDCDRQFNSSQSLEQHLQDATHSPKLNHQCQLCRRQFGTAIALKDHIRDKDHPKIKCDKCSREFLLASALQQHLQSPAHQPLSNLHCIGSSCRTKFSTPSGLIHHLESGVCSSGMSRKKLNRLVLLHDTDRLITRPQHDADDLLLDVNKRLATITQGQNTEVGTLNTRPSSCDSKASLTPSWTPGSESLSPEEWAVLVSQSGTKRCPFCASERLPFASELALHQHLQSAAHCEPFVFCPSPLGPKLMSSKHQSVRSFNTISGLVQHLESGKCSGGMATFWKAISYLETRLELWGLDIKLIA